jgi:Zn-dependent protease with chaperone function
MPTELDRIYFRVRNRCIAAVAIYVIATFLICFRQILQFCLLGLAAFQKHDWRIFMLCSLPFIAAIAVVRYFRQGRAIEALGSALAVCDPLTIATDDDPFEKRIIEIFGHLLKQTGVDLLKIPLFIRHSAELIAEYFSGDQWVLVSTSYANSDFSDDEYSGALAHELGHFFCQDDGRRQISHICVVVSLALFVIGGWHNHIHSLVSRILVWLAVNLIAWLIALFCFKYCQRVEERACDEVAVLLTNHDGLGRFLERWIRCGGLLNQVEDEATVNWQLWGWPRRNKGKFGRLFACLVQPFLPYDFAGVRIERVQKLLSERRVLGD